MSENDRHGGRDHVDGHTMAGIFAIRTGSFGLYAWVLAFTAALVPSLSARADELRPLPVLDSGFSGCAPHAPGTVRPMRLSARATVRNDVGPYSVTLPGYARPDVGAAVDSYAPFLIEACRGDQLRIDLENAPPGQTESAINLHTHGMIVQPTPDVPGPPSDYIFMQLKPGQRVGYQLDIPATLPGDLFGRYVAPQPYPTGLFWFHNHLHGFSADTVTAGQAGVLSVGDPLTLEHREADGTFVAQSFPQGTDVKYLAISDIQLSVPNCPAAASDCQPGQPMFPDRVTRPPYAHGVTWLKGDSYDTTLCAGPTTVSGPGFCGVPAGSGASKVWLFTVNGQSFPQITLLAGHNQLWRVANLSASATCVLELKDDASGNLQPVHVVNIDGIVAGTPMANDPHEMAGVHLRHLLLMPGSRAEVFIASQDFAGTQDGAPRELTLQTAGIVTGQAGVGDPWPPVRLAHVHVEATQVPAREPVGLTVARRNPTSAPPAAPSRPGAQPTPPAGCVTLPAGDRRVITFAQDNASNVFMLGSEVVDGNGNPVPGTKIAPAAYPHAAITWEQLVAALPGGMRVCPTLGALEVWELVNTTDELHNFHIHQTRFRLADGRDSGAPPGLVVGQTNNCRAEPQQSVCDPGNVVGAVMPEFDSATPAGNVTIWHDSLPVPPRLFDPVSRQFINGRVFIAIPFMAPVQVGRFVFHCHILEHEDGGMMAPIEVLAGSG